MTKEEIQLAKNQEIISRYDTLIELIKNALADFKDKKWWMKILAITDLINKLLSAINDHETSRAND